MILIFKSLADYTGTQLMAEECRLHRRGHLSPLRPGQPQLGAGEEGGGAGQGGDHHRAQGRGGQAREGGRREGGGDQRAVGGSAAAVSAEPRRRAGRTRFNGKRAYIPISSPIILSHAFGFS